MAKRLTYNIITGNDPRLRMCFYYSPHFGQNIWRRGTSLTGERTQKDPAFKGFRKSSSRLKEASPIAASLYKLVPKPVKQYPLYRTLTGEAIKMLKEGMEAAVIKETLKTKYIDPLIDSPEEKIDSRPAEETTNGDRVKGMPGFTAYRQGPSGTKRIRSHHRHRILQMMEERQAAIGYCPSTDIDHWLRTEITISESSIGAKEEQGEPLKRKKTTDGLIYLGRLPACKKLKIWARASIV
jgi:hypothetical protein